MSISDSNNVNISNTRFLNAYNRVLRVYNSSNLTIDRSQFSHNYRFVAYDCILELRSKNFAITRSNFTNNVAIHSYSDVINTRQSVGFISCCNFTNNSVKSYGAIIELSGHSLVTNSTFLSNNLTGYSDVIRSPATVISSVFQFNTLGNHGSVISLRAHGSVLASELSHNRAGRYGHSIDVYSQGNNVISCNQFHNNSNTDNRDLDSSARVLNNNSIGCGRYAIGEDGVCTNPNCEGIIST